VCSRLYLGLCKQQRNRLTTRFSVRIPVVKRSVTLYITSFIPISAETLVMLRESTSACLQHNAQKIPRITRPPLLAPPKLTIPKVRNVVSVTKQATKLEVCPLTHTAVMRTGIDGVANRLRV